MDVAFVLVHYHSADLLRRAVAAILADVEAGGIAAEILVVDNGSSDVARAVLDRLPVRCLRSSCNVGYAAALNTGIASSSTEFLFLMNPDVFVLPGCTAALIRALEDGAAAAGAKFYWDHRKQFIMPPTEMRTRRSELLAALAEHGDVTARWARHQWRRHARRHWLATRPMRTVALSGALLAVHRIAVEQVGRFDEGFRLDCEEQDWLARLVHKGLFSLYVPAAEAVHLFNQSAVQESAAVEWFAQSNARFAKRYYGAWFPKLLAAEP